MTLPSPRHKTREVRIGSTTIGGEQPIRVQSMTSTDTTDVDATADQIRALADAGCEIVRLTVDTPRAARALPEIRRRTAGIPLVADIHFSSRLAIEAAPYVDKIRINPGNIGSADEVRAVVERANEFELPIRVGVNQGSLEREVALRYGAIESDGALMPPEHGYPAQALVDSALHNIEILEELGFTRTVISVKSSSVPQMVEAYRLLADRCDYPLHLGVTEAGTLENSAIKSSIGIGALLLDGIGDTLRVSIAARATEEKIAEVRAGFKILRALGLRRWGVEIVSCPTCGREDQGFDTTRIANEIESLTAQRTRPLRIAVMGCYVNGPGEAAEADLGVVASGQSAKIYCRGKVIQSRVPFEEVLGQLMRLIETFDAQAER